MPVSVVVHGHDDRTWIALADCPEGGAVSELVARIMQALAALLVSTPQQA
jgi:hypothetical protein